LVSMEVDIRAELGSAEMRMLVPAAGPQRGCCEGVRGWSIPVRPSHSQPLSPCGFPAYLPWPWDSF
jgi:hypothetical protein